AASDRWWLRAEMLVVGAAAVAGCSVFFSRPAFCTTEEGLCSTEECACADPAHGLRELRTPDGKECRQCVAACPVANGSEERPPPGSLHVHASSHRLAVLPALLDALLLGAAP
ncbi:unnamed protein product, partial [Prorocentrum cordatum]